MIPRNEPLRQVSMTRASSQRRSPGPARSRLTDIAAAVAIVPMLVVAWQAVRVAWRVYHPPRRRSRQSPQSFGLTAERVTVPGAGGVELACWWIPAGPGGTGETVVLGHGMGSDSSKLLPLAVALHEAGYHVFTFDLRHHGASGDDRRLRGLSGRYGADHHRVVQYLRTRPECGPGRLACLGVSMSAWTALEAARRDPALVRAVICDSGPQLDITAAIRRTYTAGRGRLPGWMRGPLMFRAGRAAFVRASVFFLRPEPWPRELGDHSIRLLFITGESDPVARPADLRDQVTWYPRAETWIVPGAGHANASIIAADEYAARVLATLDTAFGRTPAPGPPTDAPADQPRR